MVQLRPKVGAAVVLGLLALVAACRANEAAAVKALAKLGARVGTDSSLPAPSSDLMST